MMSKTKEPNEVSKELLHLLLKRQNDGYSLLLKLGCRMQEVIHFLEEDSQIVFSDLDEWKSMTKFMIETKRILGNPQDLLEDSAFGTGWEASDERDDPIIMKEGEELDDEFKRWEKLNACD